MAGFRVFLVVAKPFHLGGGVDGELAVFFLLALSEQTHRAMERGRAGHVRVVQNAARRSCFVP
jgi:hypothetical protein